MLISNALFLASNWRLIVHDELRRLEHVVWRKCYRFPDGTGKPHETPQYYSDSKNTWRRVQVSASPTIGGGELGLENYFDYCVSVPVTLYRFVYKINNNISYTSENYFMQFSNLNFDTCLSWTPKLATVYALALDQPQNCREPLYELQVSQRSFKCLSTFTPLIYFFWPDELKNAATSLCEKAVLLSGFFRQLGLCLFPDVLLDGSWFAF